jgi:MerR family transcriptional regulator, thiopeptide resistance regulator
MGIPLKQMKKLLDKSNSAGSLEILKRRLRVLGREIANLRKQHQIIEILKQKQIQQGVDMLSKERWVEIMRAAGLTDEDMHNWHIKFEKMEPEAHQEFLESLGIKAVEIAEIRKWSRSV